MRWNNLFIVALYGFILPMVSVAKEVSYQQHIKPVLDKKCVVCHACSDAPCQLILTHGEGLFRGANKQRVYNGLRTAPASPTRLFIDAQTSQDWRKKDFFPVLTEDTNTDVTTKSSVLKRLLLMSEKHRFKPNSRLPETMELGLKRKNLCPAPDEINDYEAAYPHNGMPLGVTGLTAKERQTLLDWLEQGAPFKPPVMRLSVSEQQAIQSWEQFLNQKGLRERLVARWLYEHLFMAHLHFSEQKNEHFFQIVRSSTPPGQPVKLIATRRPNDNPGKTFFYRIQAVQGTIVYKTHITFALNKALLDRIKTLFFTGDWNIDRLPDYKEDDRTNPFQTFVAIPASARYRFMLEHAEYFVQTFIRGPVCHGQIATDVIRDQFWVFFQTPESDAYVTSAEYRKRATPFMDIAGVEHDLLDGANTWFSVRKQYNRYSNMRQAAYEKSERAAANINHIWDGDGSNTNALLTVFRHHDNASVRKGLIGDYPLTVWWMDYPLLERGYYNLVVNFDVFGSVSHQAQTRLYFDLIRNDAERNFLRLMPARTRQVLIDQWYEGAAQLKLLTSYQAVSTRKDSGVGYKTDDHKRELLDRLLKSHADVNQRPDMINRQDKHGSKQGQNADVTQRANQALRRIASREAGDFPALELFPEVTFIRVFDSAGGSEIYSVFRNRIHTNVAFLYGESLRYKPERDTLTVFPGILASYPNFMFNIPADEVDSFVDTLLAVKDEPAFEKNIVQRWGVRRTHPRFWELFHELTAYLQNHMPIEAGVMDMSRYVNL